MHMHFLYRVPEGQICRLLDFASSAGAQVVSVDRDPVDGCWRAIFTSGVAHYVAEQRSEYATPTFSAEGFYLSPADAGMI